MKYYHDKASGDIYRGASEAAYLSQGFEPLGEFPDLDSYPTKCLSVKKGVLAVDTVKHKSHDDAARAQELNAEKRSRIMAALVDPSVLNFEAERKKILGV